MRDLRTVITIVQLFIPATFTEVHRELNKIKDDCLYQAPEVMSHLWVTASRILQTLPSEPEWIKTVQKIWLNRPI